MDALELAAWLEKLDRKLDVQCEKLDTKLDAQSENIHLIKVQTTKTNGRVTALEDIITHRRLGVGKIITYGIAISAIVVSFIK